MLNEGQVQRLGNRKSHLIRLSNFPKSISRILIVGILVWMMDLRKRVISGLDLSLQ